jgi:hypothetical protein
VLMLAGGGLWSVSTTTHTKQYTPLRVPVDVETVDDLGLVGSRLMSPSNLLENGCRRSVDEVEAVEPDTVGYDDVGCDPRPRTATSEHSVENRKVVDL